jgi:hypothetical protein
MSDETPTTLMLCRDLMFVGKVTATARATGTPVRVIRDVAKVPAEGTRLIVDLNEPGAIDAAKTWKGATAGAVIGFVAHTDADAIAQARAAGFDQVMTRGQFTAKLEEILST